LLDYESKNTLLFYKFIVMIFSQFFKIMFMKVGVKFMGQKGCAWLEYTYIYI